MLSRLIALATCVYKESKRTRHGHNAIETRYVDVIVEVHIVCVYII